MKFVMFIFNIALVSVILATNVFGVATLTTLASAAYWIFTICSPLLLLAAVVCLCSEDARKDTHKKLILSGNTLGILPYVMATYAIVVFAMSGYVWLTAMYILWLAALGALAATKLD